MTKFTTNLNCDETDFYSRLLPGTVSYVSTRHLSHLHVWNAFEVKQNLQFLPWHILYLREIHFDFHGLIKVHSISRDSLIGIYNYKYIFFSYMGVRTIPYFILNLMFLKWWILVFLLNSISKKKLIDLFL